MISWQKYADNIVKRSQYMLQRYFKNWDICFQVIDLQIASFISRISQLNIYLMTARYLHKLYDFIVFHSSQFGYVHWRRNTQKFVDRFIHFLTSSAVKNKSNNFFFSEIRHNSWKNKIIYLHGLYKKVRLWWTGVQTKN